jgi:phage-related protein
MSTFPALKTGAVMQYPAQRGVQFSTVALQFVDGSEQRFQSYQAPLHQWVIQLSLLDQAELQELQEFFRSLDGRAENFAFTDPWNATSYASCSLGSDSMSAILAGEWNGQTSLTVMENGS